MERQGAIVAQAIPRAQEMVKERLAEKIRQSHEEAIRRQLQNGEKGIGNAPTYDGLTMHVTFRAGVEVEATASAAYDETMEWDLLATEEKDGNKVIGEKPFRPIDVESQVPIIPGFVGAGFTVSSELNMPLALRATFDAAGTMTAKADYMKKYEIVILGDENQLTELDVDNERPSLTPSAARMGASLSLSIGLRADLNVQFEITLVSSIKLYANAGVRMEAKAGSDLALCMGNTPNWKPDELCGNMGTRLTEYIEYDGQPEGETEYSAGTVVVQAGVWGYVTYPQIYLGGGVSAPGLSLAAECGNFPTSFKHFISFGKGDDDGKVGQDHPYGGYIARFSKAWRWDKNILPPIIQPPGFEGTTSVRTAPPPPPCFNPLCMPGMLVG
jgi:hypothetical protein